MLTKTNTYILGIKSMRQSANENFLKYKLMANYFYDCL
jgi:hypothetical protein